MPIVGERTAMIAGMAPDLVAGDVAFVTVPSLERALALAGASRALIQEAEGITLILPRDHAAVPADAAALRQITLRVHSALDGVGLTAAVAETLAALEIPCNVVAGFHHDHIYVPSTQADGALAALIERAREAQRLG